MIAVRQDRVRADQPEACKSLCVRCSEPLDGVVVLPVALGAMGLQPYASFYGQLAEADQSVVAARGGKPRRDNGLDETVAKHLDFLYG